MSKLYELPNGWEWQKLINISSLDNQTVAPKDDEEYNYISLEHIESNTGKIVNFTKSVGSEIQSSKVAFPKGAVLYGKLRPYLNKVAIAPFDGIATTEILPIKPHISQLNPYFLAFYLRSDGFVSEAMSNISGARMPRITMTFVRDDLHIPLPPLTEQQRIVEKLEKLFEKIDKAIALHQKNIDEADAFMGSALNEVFGELEEKYGLNPISTLFRIRSGDFLPKKNMVEDGDVDVYGGNGINGRHNASNLSGLNIVIGRVGALCGNVRCVDGEIWLTDNAFYISEYLEQIDKYFLSQMLIHIDLGSSANKAAQPVISYKGISEMKLPLPPLPTQQKVVTYLDDLSVKIERVKTVQKGKMDSLKALKASILDKAFRGQL